MSIFEKFNPHLNFPSWIPTCLGVIEKNFPHFPSKQYGFEEFKVTSAELSVLIDKCKYNHTATANINNI